MKALAETSIKNKLLKATSSAILISAIFIEVILLPLIIYFRVADQIDVLKIDSLLICETLKAPLIFNDKSATQAALENLRISPFIRGAAVLDKDYNLFASYPSHYKPNIPRLDLTDINVDFHWTYLSLSVPLEHGHEKIGTFHLERGLKDIYLVIIRILAILNGGIIFAVLFTTYLVRKMSATILGPLSELSELTSHITKHGDFSLRANINTGDELEALANAFNNMLDTIEADRRELKEYQGELESLVLERTQELLRKNKELKEAQAQLIHASKLSALGEMAAGIAHEINQPLNIVKLLCQKIMIKSQRGLLPPLHSDLKDALEKIDSQIDRAVTIMEHLRAFSRRDSLELSPIDVVTVIENVFLLLGQGLRLKGINVVKDIGERPLIIKGNENLLEQVLYNLVSNARDAMMDLPGSKEKRLTIKAYRSSDNKAIIEVADTGPGIPEEIRERVFEPFFTTKEVGNGTGLGLYISYGIVKQLGGEIEFETEEGIGTRFFLTFDLV